MSEQQVFDKSQEPSNNLEDWVGEGKKYASMEEMAKANLHAQPMIDSLSRQVNELKEDLLKRVSLEDALDRLEQRATEAPLGDHTVTENTTQPQGLTKEEIDRLLSQRLGEELNNFKEAATAEENLKRVNDTLVDRYGDRAKELVARKATELDVTPEFLKEMSMSNPKATLALFSQTAAPATPGSERGSVNSEALGHSDGKVSYKKLQELRRSDPDKYFSPAVQQQIIDAATAQGADFFNS